MENEAVEETDAITGDEACSTSDIVERKKKSVIWSFFTVHKEDKSKAVCLTIDSIYYLWFDLQRESVTRREQSEEF